MPKPGEDWVCDVIIDEFAQHTRHEIVHSPRDADVIFLYAKWIWKHIPHGMLASRPVITTVHHIVPEKVDPHEFVALDSFTDLYHVPNVHTHNQVRNFTQKSIRKLPYWANGERWFQDDSVASRHHVLLDLMHGKRVLASFQRDTEGSSSFEDPRPKLEKGPDVFVDVVRRFDAQDVMAYVPGWRRRFITKNLLSSGHPHLSEDKLDPEAMNDQYNIVRTMGGCYLVTSRHEGGPQAVIEASLTKTWILSTDVGIASEVLHPSSIVTDGVDGFVRKLRSGPDPDVIEHNYRSAQRYLIAEMVPQYDRMIDEVAGG